MAIDGEAGSTLGAGNTSDHRLSSRSRDSGSGFASIVFDCDSTLAAIEGIDELAGDRIAEVRALTDAAMQGEIPLEDVYGRRLDIIRPDRDAVEALGRLYIARMVEDAADTVAALVWLG